MRKYWLLACLLSWAPLARADDADKARCVQGHLDGQRHRNQGDLDAARRELRTCVVPSCPDLIRRDCVAWLREVERLVPTLVFLAQNQDGADVDDVRVSIDGRLVQKRLAGEPVEVSAGKHTIRFERRGSAPVETRIIVALGEKNRLVRTTLIERATSPDAVRAVPWVLGGFGQAASTTGLLLDLLGAAEVQRLRADCAPDCDSADVARARHMVIAGDTLLVAGIVSVVAGTLWLVLRDR